MTAKKHEDDIFNEENEVQSNWIKFNVPLEDKITGTLIAIREMKSTLPGKEGEMVKIYELKADSGSFHELDEKKKVIPEPVVVEAGSIWSIGGKPIIDRQMQNIKIGQKIGLKFIEEVPAKTKGFNPAKTIRVYTPKNDDGSYKMDEAFLAERNGDDGFGN